MTGTILFLAVFLPLCGALLLSIRLSTDAVALHQSAWLTALLTFGLAIAVVVQFDWEASGMQHRYTTSFTPWQESRLPALEISLSVDEQRVWLVPFIAAITLVAMIAARPIPERPNPKWRASLALSSAALGVATADHVLVVFLFLTLARWATSALLRGERDESDALGKRLPGLFAAADVTILLAMLLLASDVALETGTWAFVSPGGLEKASLEPPTLAWSVFGAIVLAGFIRTGLFPFQAWIVALARRSGANHTLAMALLPLVGLTLLARMAAMVPSDAVVGQAGPWLGTLLAVGAVLAGIACIGEHDRRRAVGYAATSALAVAALGIASRFAGDIESAGDVAGLFLAQMTSLAVIGLLVHPPIARHSAALLVLCAAIIGLPPTGNFAARVAVLPAVWQTNLFCFVMVLIAWMLPARSLLHAGYSEDATTTEVEGSFLAARIAAVLCVLTSLAPQALIGWYRGL
ncbi:NADH:ubiquinone oxidoreductase subunit M [Planctomycetes bacterium Pan216]|uniref:NADH:ubiquinone oxidoreductase subunit M n=1 Tax=Kolteria novifilia TaxID=2527975 RepID=A0A518B682_9BACT|nr:NADH:ubiquinone oxidoreductase subunit M [Planctomycetes bacterium Pan216]